jgi:sugar O-acyltransferase (sialic acid O-acetyltransferase NeuD family)
VGAGGHAISVAETVLAAGWQLIGFVDVESRLTTLLSRPVLDAFPSDYLGSGGLVVIAIGDNYTRQRVWNEIASSLPAPQFPAFIHPTASVSTTAHLGIGTVVLQGVIVGSSARVGMGCILNSGSILEHECIMGDFSSLAPGVVTGGRVHLGQRSALSIGATIKHGVKIGVDSVVGAASYVNQDIPPNVVAYGSPAKVIRGRDPEDTYLS